MTSMSAAWDPRFATLRGAMKHRGRLAAFAARGPGNDDAFGGPGGERPRGPGRPGRRRGARGFDGPGFGPEFPPGFGPGSGPGFGPEFGGGPRGRGRRGLRRSRGDIRLAVLALLAEQPRHGYEIIQEINERTQGSWRPSPGSVYPTLQQLADEGLVRTEESDGRRTVSLTEAGTSYVEEHRDELGKVWDTAAGDEVSAEVSNLRTQYGQLHAAVAQVMSAGTDEQREAAATALAEARKTIYRLLAE
jgi:DNA-binding PadR family transcriptional regulator